MSENEKIVQQIVEETIPRPVIVRVDETDWSSPAIGKLASALSKAQGEMGSVKKIKRNSFYPSAH